MRDKSGRFVKGYSGNAGGRPKDEHNIAALARSYSTEAIETLVDLMRNARDDRVRGTAAQALLDRGFGKPKVEIQNTNADFRDALEQVQSRLGAILTFCQMSTQLFKLLTPNLAMMILLMLPANN
jgi:hypothetical protein